MDRRTLLKTALALPLLPLATKVDAFVTGGGRWLKRGAAGWPTDADWESLNRQVGGRLSIPKNPLLDPATREEALAHIGNQFYVATSLVLPRPAPTTRHGRPPPARGCSRPRAPKISPPR